MARKRSTEDYLEIIGKLLTKCIYKRSKTVKSIIKRGSTENVRNLFFGLNKITDFPIIEKCFVRYKHLDNGMKDILISASDEEIEYSDDQVKERFLFIATGIAEEFCSTFMTDVNNYITSYCDRMEVTNICYDDVYVITDRYGECRGFDAIKTKCPLSSEVSLEDLVSFNLMFKISYAIGICKDKSLT